MGANLALYISSEEHSFIKKCILISPDIEVRADINYLFNESQIQELEEKGYTYRKGLYINKSFIDHIRNKAGLSVANRIIVPTIIYQGDSDEIYTIEGARQLSGKIKNSRLVVINGGDHNYLNQNARKRLMQNIINDLNRR